jgi:hypothetical protein
MEKPIWKHVTVRCLLVLSLSLLPSFGEEFKIGDFVREKGDEKLSGTVIKIMREGWIVVERKRRRSSYATSYKANQLRKLTPEEARKYSEEKARVAALRWEDRLHKTKSVFGDVDWETVRDIEWPKTASGVHLDSAKPARLIRSRPIKFRRSPWEDSGRRIAGKPVQEKVVTCCSTRLRTLPGALSLTDGVGENRKSDWRNSV